MAGTDPGAPGPVTGATLYFKGYVPSGAWRFYAGAGPGIFKPSGASTTFGISLAGGVNRPLNPQVEFDAGAAYFHLFRGQDLGFLGLRVGVKIVF